MRYILTTTAVPLPSRIPTGGGAGHWLVGWMSFLTTTAVPLPSRIPTGGGEGHWLVGWKAFLTTTAVPLPSRIPTGGGEGHWLVGWKRRIAWAQGGCAGPDTSLQMAVIDACINALPIASGYRGCATFMNH